MKTICHNYNIALLRRYYVVLLIVILKVFASTTGSKTGKAFPLKYCVEENFINDYVKKDVKVPADLVKDLERNCRSLWNDIRKCKTDKMYPFLTFHNSSESFIIGAMSAQPKDKKIFECWAYILELYSHQKNKVVFYKYFTKNTVGYKEGAIGFSIPFPSEDYGEEFTITLSAFPDGGTVEKNSRVMPKNYCQKIARYEAVKLYWEEYNKRKDCREHFVEGNMQRVAEQFCTFFKNTTDTLFITKKIPEKLSVKYCIVSFNVDNPSIIENAVDMSKYVWLLVSIILVCIISFVSYKCIMGHKKKGLADDSNSIEKMLPSGSESTVSSDSSHLTEKPLGHALDVSLPSDIVSVMILHRPGCEQLDNFVRDLSYILHLHGIQVTSPLLEMSQIDAEGGIATYIQRNVNTCTYVIVMVTESNTEVVHRNHKPFEFSMKMLSGLAFRDNDSSRYIPVYINEYKDILQCIPVFLAASRNCGYRIPGQLTELVQFMTKKEPDNKERSKEFEAKLNFFFKKLNLYAGNCLKPNHKNCCQGACAQGTIPDDVSELWTGTSSVRTKQTNRNKEQYLSITTVGRSEATNIHKLDLILDSFSTNNKINSIETWRMHSIKNSEFQNYNRSMVASMPFLYQSSQ